MLYGVGGLRKTEGKKTRPSFVFLKNNINKNTSLSPQTRITKKTKKGKPKMYNLEEVREVLQDNAYIIKQHINLCNEIEKAIPLRAYEKTIKVLGELNQEPQEQKQKEVLLKVNPKDIKPIEIVREPVSASTLLVKFELIYENQGKSNNAFIKYCEEWKNKYGEKEFSKVLEHIKAHNTGNIKNIYAYIRRALDNREQELKKGGAKYE